jgi:hypothetical protein
VLAGACARVEGPVARSDDAGLPAEGPYVRGPVESITHRSPATGLVVRAGPGSRDQCGISATADKRTRYLRRASGGGVEPSALSEIRTGDVVEVYVDGPIAESCPVQGHASVVVLVR